MTEKKEIEGGGRQKEGEKERERERGRERERERESFCLVRAAVAGFLCAHFET